MISSKRRSNSGIFLAATVAFLAHSTGWAAITWSWNFSGIDGYFVTDGDLVSGNAPAATYNVTDFGVTDNGLYSIPTGGILSGDWNEGSQPGTGFIWDGAQVTQYFRRANSGFPLTNGTNYYSSAGDRLLFFPGSYSLNDSHDMTLTSANQANETAIPEPSGFGLLCLASAALGLRRRRSA